MKRILSFSYTFVMLNAAAVVGLYCFLTGKKDVWFRHKSVHTHQR